jgi:hypothetical protein
MTCFKVNSNRQCSGPSNWDNLPTFLPSKGTTMRWYTKLASALTVAFVLFSIFASAGHAACKTIGTIDCPDYTAPATTAVPGPSMNGSMTVPPNGMAVTLFNGAVPPNGFMIQMNDPSQCCNYCYINDNQPANIQYANNLGFIIFGNRSPENFFVTPPGYRAMGPVSIACNISLPIAARGW